MDGETVELLRGEKGWEVKAKTTLPGDTPTIESVVDHLAQLHAKRVAAYPAKDPAAYGLDKPAAVFTVRFTGADGKPATKIIQIGKPTTDGDTKGDRFVRVENGATIGVLPSVLAGTLLGPALEFRNRNLLNLSNVDRATLERGQRKAVFEAANGSWKMLQPVDAPAEQTDLQEFCIGRSAPSLAVDRLIADKPADLATYGLDKPSARWIFQLAGKNVLELLLGKSTVDGKVYAKLAGNDLVFLLDPNLAKQAEAEYRSRTVWPAPLDAVQIEKIHFGGQENPFGLEKVDNVWKVTGKPTDNVNQDAVKELLDALAGLKAARFVADKTGDLKLYGLDPAQRTIEIQTQSGKRTLLIGRQEGESSRYYVRVPEGEVAQAVFVVSEDAARKIVKPLSGFLQASPGAK